MRKLTALLLLLLVSSISYGAPAREMTVPVDGLTQAVPIVEYSHHELHDGRAFVTYGNATLATSDTLVIGLTTSNTTRQLHLIPHIRCSGEGNLTIHEGATFASGDALTPINRNRNSTNATTATTVQSNPTVSVAGTSIYLEHFGSGRSIGVDSRGDEEWILGQNTSYTFTITSEANSNDCNMKLDWYEHVDRR